MCTFLKGAFGLKGGKAEYDESRVLDFLDFGFWILASFTFYTTVAIKSTTYLGGSANSTDSQTPRLPDSQQSPFFDWRNPFNLFHRQKDE